MEQKLSLTHRIRIFILQMDNLRDRPVVTKPPPQWSLEKVLEELQKEIYSNNSDTCCLLKKALFLVALGTGWRALHY